MINFNINPDEFNKQLAKIAEESYKKINFPRIYRGIGEVLQTSINFQFEQEGAYFGSKWAPLAPSTIAQRQRRGRWPGKILQVDGGLASRFTYSISGNSVTIGTNVEYAKYLHHGTRRMPARPLFASLLTNEVKEEIRFVILKGLRD